MKTHAFLTALAAWLILSALAISQDAKLDSIMQSQKELLAGQNVILQEVVYDDPLAGKSTGVEFNPAYFLLASAADQLVLSGGFSLFNIHPKAELAFPVYYHTHDRNDYTSKLFTLDAHYRYFLGKKRNGFYLSGSVRYAYISGEDDRWDDNPNQYERIANVHKFGVMCGVGYRVFSKSGFYWGTSLSLGRYFSNEFGHIDDAGLDATKFLLDIELLKFGYAF